MKTTLKKFIGRTIVDVIEGEERIAIFFDNGDFLILNNNKFSSSIHTETFIENSKKRKYKKRKKVSEPSKKEKSPVEKKGGEVFKCELCGYETDDTFKFRGHKAAHKRWPNKDWSKVKKNRKEINEDKVHKTILKEAVMRYAEGDNIYRASEKIKKRYGRYIDPEEIEKEFKKSGLEKNRTMAPN